MRSRERPGPVLGALLCLSLALPSCGAGRYVWVDQLPSQGAEASADVIATDDVVNIRVYNQEPISTRARVGPDGTISVPLAGEIVARGQSTGALARQIEARLKPFIVAPSVIVTLDEIHVSRVSVLGEVAHPGVFPVPPGAGPLEALALAGGLTEFADRDRVFVLRASTGREPLRIRLTYKDLTRGLGRSAAFRLQAGDAVVVE